MGPLIGIEMQTIQRHETHKYTRRASVCTRSLNIGVNLLLQRFDLIDVCIWIVFLKS